MSTLAAWDGFAIELLMLDIQRLQTLSVPRLKHATAFGPAFIIWVDRIKPDGLRIQINFLPHPKSYNVRVTANGDSFSMV